MNTTYIIILLPILTLITFIIKYINVINYEIIYLILSNIFIIPTSSLCYYFSITKQKNLWLEFISSYLVVFSSGIYHLCQFLYNYLQSK